MGDLLATIGEFYVWGLVTAGTAFCVIVLYPAFLARLARQVSEDPEARNNPRVLGFFGVLVTVGVISFMALVGVVFTFVLEESVNLIVEYISPIAFTVLLIIGVALMFDIKFSRQVRPIRIKDPHWAAFVYGFFFGAIVIPCNPGIIALAFARASLIPVGERMAAFLAFGIGIGTPLLAFSLVSRAASRWILSFLVDHKTAINRVAGAIMVGVSIYYLFWVFRVHETVLGL